MRALSQSADALGPVKDFLNATPHDQAGLVAAALCGASVRRASRPPAFDLRAVRSDCVLAAVLHELLPVIALVSSQRPGLEAKLFEFVERSDGSARLPSCLMLR